MSMAKKKETEEVLEILFKLLTEGRYIIRIGSIQQGLKKIEKRNLTDEVMKHPEKYLEEKIVEWWEETLTKKEEVKNNWKEFKKRLILEFGKEELEKKTGEMPWDIIQLLRENLEDWIKRVKRVGEDAGVSKDEIAKRMILGLRQQTVRDEIIRRFEGRKLPKLEDIEVIVVETWKESLDKYRETRRRKR